MIRNPSRNESESSGRVATAERVKEVRDLVEDGLHLRAYAAAQQLAPLRDWTGVDRAHAGSLAYELGAPRLARWHWLKAWREAPSDASVRLYYAVYLFHYRGPYFAWRLLERFQQSEDESTSQLAYRYGLNAQVLSALRDFDRAETFLEQAEQVAPADYAGVHVVRAQVLEREDRYDEALRAAEQARRIAPWDVAAVRSAAHLLALLDRDRDAVELLEAAAAQLEAACVYSQLAALQTELGEYEAAQENFNQYEAHAPLLEEDVAKWLAGNRSRLAYYAGDVDAAIEFARQSQQPYFETIADNLSDESRRAASSRELPVGFVRQHHKTCAPATLSTIGRFWSQATDHLEVADEICYNGTSHYHERRWAEENGWFVREFTVTEQSAQALIDKGIPFTLTTVQPANSHLQAVIGFDGRRGTLRIRDPFFRNRGEALCTSLLESQRGHGPRGMALVPHDQQVLLEGMQLPDTELWDQLHHLDSALEAHNRDEAEKAWRELQQIAGEHRITLEAQRRLAYYDDNPTEMLAAVERLVELFPRDQSWQLSRLHAMRDLRRRSERLEGYRALCAQQDSHPVVWQQYAQELRHDARLQDPAARLLLRAIRRWPDHGPNYYVLAHIYWDQRRYDEALALYRIATCLDDANEQMAMSFFAAAQHFRQTEQALAFLDGRFRRFASKSSLPARTLYAAYVRLEQQAEGLRVLDRALDARPDDGELILLAAVANARWSDDPAKHAEELLASAAERTSHTSWLRTAAWLAAYRGEVEQSLASWRQLLELKPLSIEAHREVARLLAQTEGRSAALRHLETFAGHFPHHHPLHGLWVEWVRGEPAEVAKSVVAKLVAMNPDDAWARRELGFLLCRLRQFKEAAREAEAAGRLAPHDAAYHDLRGDIFLGQQRIEEAKQAYRDAIGYSVDDEYATTRLFGICATRDERLQELEFVKHQLVEQVVSGDGLLAFREHARGTLDAAELAASLREARDARPDLWHAWSAYIHQLLDIDDKELARQTASDATEKFPLLPRLWVDLAEVCRIQGDDSSELSALQTAHRINPDWNPVINSLSGAYERAGEFASSRALLERAVARDPNDAEKLSLLAHLLWRLEERAAALDHVERAALHDPSYRWAWESLRDWSLELGQAERSVRVSRKLTRERAGEARSWLLLAQTLAGAEHLDERLAALAKAIELNPRSVDAFDLRAQLLAEAGRFAEAQQVCAEACWEGAAPIKIRLRAATIAADQGSLAGAISAAREIARDEPNDFTVWRSLANWYREVGNNEQYLEAAQHLVRLAPQHWLSLGYLGDANALNGQRAEARSALERAFSLAPDYEFAGMQLFDLQFVDGELDAAAATLSLLQTHVGGPFVGARAVQLASRRRDRTAAENGFREIGLAAQTTQGLVELAAQALDDEGWGESVDALLLELLDDPAVNPHVAACWVQRSLRRRDWSCQDRLAALTRRGEVGRQATYAYVCGLAEAGRRFRLLRFVRLNADWLARDTYCWGGVAYALATLRCYPRLVRWMEDWREYRDAEPWMLINLVEALRATGRRDSAALVCRHALSLPSDHASKLHAIWLAADDALAGEIVAAEAAISGIDPATLSPGFRFVHVMVESIVTAARTSADTRRQTFREIRRRVRAAVATRPDLPHEPADRWMYHQTVRSVARHVGGVIPWLWSRCVLLTPL